VEATKSYTPRQKIKPSLEATKPYTLGTRKPSLRGTHTHTHSTNYTRKPCTCRHFSTLHRQVLSQRHTEVLSRRDTEAHSRKYTEALSLQAFHFIPFHSPTSCISITLLLRLHATLYALAPIPLLACTSILSACLNHVKRIASGALTGQTSLIGSHLTITRALAGLSKTLFVGELSASRAASFV